MAATDKRRDGDVGLQDAIADGAFNDRTGELRPGFSITADDVVLDVGCGAGNESLFCARQGAHVIYADIDPEQVRIAGAKLAGMGARALTPVVSNTNPLPLPDGIASKVMALEVLEHVDDPAQFLRELTRVGQPGAWYLLAVPDPAAEKIQVGVAAPVHFQKPNHIRIIEREAFAEMARDAGLVVVHRGTYGFYWAIWWMLFWICGVALGEPHPLLASWSKTWGILLDMPDSAEVRASLNSLLPKSQYIIARKPGGAVGSMPAGAAQAVQASTKNATVLPGMLRKLQRLFSFRPALQAQTAPARVEDPIDSRTVGLHDAVESGWFNMAAQELFTDFPINADDVVLDVGCGKGQYSTLCGKWGAHVMFADIDAENVAATKLLLAETPARGITPIIGAADPLPIADGMVSKIISTEVIEHVDDPVRFMAELARVGKPGALYLLAVPDPVQEGLQRKLAPAAFFVKPTAQEGSIRGLSSGHLRTIGRDEFEQLVTDAGLVVEQHRYVGFYWALWFTFFWICDVDFSAPLHPLLASWARTWKLVLDAPDGHKVKRAMDAFMPKSQIIIARKPGLSGGSA